VTDHNALTIYTDGSASHGPRKGGVGYLMVYPTADGTGEVQIVSDEQGYKDATNNEMELMAAVLALERVPELDLPPRVNRVIVKTDSLYLRDNFGRAAFQWSKNKWHNVDGVPMANAEIWKRLIKARKAIKKNVEFQWVKGHAKDPLNITVDQLAKMSRNKLLKPALKYTDVRRKISNKKTKVGSVIIDGQTMKIRIITCQWQKTQKIFKLRYEVLSKERDDFNCVDYVFSKIPLRTGHSYLVEMNDSPNNPRVAQIIREIGKEEVES
jgi:ribonuclease HI